MNSVVLQECLSFRLNHNSTEWTRSSQRNYLNCRWCHNCSLSWSLAWMPIAASTGGVFTFTGTTHKRQPFWYPLSSFNNVTSSDYFQLLRELWCRGLCQGILSAAAILKNQSACHLVFDFPLKFFTIFRVAETIIKKCLFTNTLAILPDSMANHSSIFSVTSRLEKTIEKLRVELNWICHSVLT